MIRILAGGLSALALAVAGGAFAQSPGGFTSGQTLTATQLNAAFQAKQNLLTGGDCSISTSGVITCTESGGQAFGTFAFQNYASPPAIGGTTPNAASFTSLTSSGVTTFSSLASAGSQCLQVSAAGVVSGAGGPCSTSSNQVVLNAAQTWPALQTFSAGLSGAIGASASSTGAFTTLTVSGAATLNDGLTLNGSGLTAPANGYNGYTPAHSGANSDITSISGLTTALSVGQGGTGASTFTTHGILLGEAGSAVAATAAMAVGQVLIGQGASADPSPATLSGDATLSSAGHITVSGIAGIAPGTFYNQNYASPPAIGGTTPNAASFTSLKSTGVTTFIGLASSGTQCLQVSSAGVVSGTGSGCSGSAFGTANIWSALQTFNAGIDTTTIVASGLIFPTSDLGIEATATNDNATAGAIGEYDSNTTSGTSLSSSVTNNCTSIYLQPGDWDVQGVIEFSQSSPGLITGYTTGLNTTSATFGSLGTYVSNTSTQSNGTNVVVATPVVRESLSTATTVYLAGSAAFPSGTVTCSGFIRARRPR